MWKCCDFECVKTGINTVSFLPVFLSCVVGACNSPVQTPAHRLLGHTPNLRLQFMLENASLLTLCICAGSLSKQTCSQQATHNRPFETDHVNKRPVYNRTVHNRPRS